MSRNALLGLGALCLLLGVGDLAALNFWLAPAAWATEPGSAEPRSPELAAPEPAAPEPAAPEPAAPEPAAPEPAAPEPAAREPAAPEPAAPEPAAPEPAAPEPAAPEPAAPEPKPDKPPTRPEVVEGQVVVHFATSAHGLDTRSRNALKRLTAPLRGVKSTAYRVVIEGHADSRGEEVFNDRLSSMRAKEVVRYLGVLGVPAHRILHKSFGSRRPQNPADTPVAWRQNRRVEIRIEKVGK